MGDELERLRLKARALELLEELDISSGILRGEMLAEPERAIAVLEYAIAQPGIRNAASFAIAQWRRGDDPRRSRRTLEAEELVEEPPTLSALEFAWSRQASPIGATLIAMMGYSIERNGGASAMLAAGWWSRELYDEDGDLVETREHLPFL